MTVDLEDFHSILLRWKFDRDGSPSDEVVENTQDLLGLLAEFDVRATFFILGEVARTHPALIKQVAAGGHELGVHGFKHFWVHTMTSAEFRREVEPAKKLIEDLTGVRVLGHRAPAFSLTLAMTWAFEVLAETGFRYDSSVYPIRGRRYGDPSAPLGAFAPAGGGGLWEIPPSAIEFLGRRWPVCGGGYLRVFPYAVSRWALRRITRTRPGVVYVHPYDIEQAPARPAEADWPLARKLAYGRFIYLQYRGRTTVRAKLRRLLAEFPFGRIVDAFPHVGGA